LGGIVTRIANGASRKWHQTRPLRKDTLAKVISYPFSGDDWKAFCLAFTFNESLQSPTPDDHFRLRAKKGITGDALASLHRLQEKSVLRISGNAHESTNRRLQVSKDRTNYRHNIALPRFALKVFE
jgi:hypothetical protein